MERSYVPLQPGDSVTALQERLSHLALPRGAQVLLVVRRRLAAPSLLPNALRLVRHTLGYVAGLATASPGVLRPEEMPDLVSGGLSLVELTLAPARVERAGSERPALLDLPLSWLAAWPRSVPTPPASGTPLELPKVGIDLRIPLTASVLAAPDAFLDALAKVVPLTQRIRPELWIGRSRMGSSRLPALSALRNLARAGLARFGDAWLAGGASLGLGGGAGLPLCLFGADPGALFAFRVGPHDWSQEHPRSSPQGPCAHCVVARACRATRGAPHESAVFRIWRADLVPFSSIPAEWRAPATVQTFHPGARATDGGGPTTVSPDRSVASFADRHVWGLPRIPRLWITADDLPRGRTADAQELPVLLVRPPWDPAREYRVDARFPPLALLRLNAVVRAQGQLTQCLDLASISGRDDLARAERVRKAIADAARTFRPRVVGLSLEAPSAEPLVEALLRGRLLPDAYTVVGGRGLGDGVALLDRCSGLDFAIEGEGDAPLAHLLRALADGREPRGVPGLCWRAAGRAFRAPQALHHPDAFPAPDLRGFDLDGYRSLHGDSAVLFEGEPFLPYSFVSGCPFRCAFCGDTLTGSYAARAPQRVAADLAELTRQGVRNFVFLNTMVNPTVPYARELSAELRSRAPAIRWTDSVHPRGLDARILGELEASGCVMLSWGVDCGSASLGRRVRKSLDPDGAARALRLSHDAGIRNIVNLIQGLPYETERDIHATCDWLRRHHETIWRVRIMPYEFLATSPMALTPEQFGLAARPDGGFDEVSGLAWPEKRAQIAESVRVVTRVAASLGLVGVAES